MVSTVLDLSAPVFILLLHQVFFFCKEIRKTHPLCPKQYCSSVRKEALPGLRKLVSSSRRAVCGSRVIERLHLCEVFVFFRARKEKGDFVARSRCCFVEASGDNTPMAYFAGSTAAAMYEIFLFLSLRVQQVDASVLTIQRTPPVVGGQMTRKSERTYIYM